MHKYPKEAVIDGKTYHYERILKDDFFSVNVLYRNGDGGRYVLKLGDCRFVLGLLLRPLAILVSQHEYRIYSMLADLEGLPRLGPRYGARGYFHEYIEGKTLYELPEGAELPEDFFDRLHTLLEQIHSRRIAYLDLNKRGNIILSDDGRPYLIDFQVCLHLKERGGWLGRWSNQVLDKLALQAIYHIYKHKKHFQRHLMTDEELKAAVQTELIKKYDRYFGKFYRKLKRLIYPKGSNEIIWYKWRKEKDRTHRMP